MQQDQPVFQRLHVWGFTVASAAAAVVVTLLAWPVKFWMIHRWAAYGMMHGGPGYGGPGQGMMYGPGFGLWHVGALVIVALWAGIAGAVIAAVYNAVTRPRA